MKIAVGLFDDYADAVFACTSLQSAGFARDDIGLMASEQAWDRTNEGAGVDTGTFGGLLVGVGALAIPGIGPVVASGPILTTLAGTAPIGVLGALSGFGIPDDHAQHYAEGVRRGGTLVMVRASDELAPSAADLLDEAGAIDVDERAGIWRARGYRGYDASAPELTVEQIARERASIPRAAEPGKPGARKARIYAMERTVEAAFAPGDQRA